MTFVEVRTNPVGQYCFPDPYHLVLHGIGYVRALSHPSELRNKCVAWESANPRSTAQPDQLVLGLRYPDTAYFMETLGE